MSLTSWKIDTTHTSVTFSVRHMVVSKVRGRFAKYSGRVGINDEDFPGSVVEACIDAASLDTGVAERDAHLRSPDFLDVEKFPEIRFRSTLIEELEELRYRVVGQLTIRDVTRQVVLDVEFGGRARDPWGNERMGFTARTWLDRRDFGLIWNHPLETGGFLVGDRVEVDLDVEVVRAAQQHAA